MRKLGDIPAGYTELVFPNIRDADGLIVNTGIMTARTYAISNDNAIPGQFLSAESYEGGWNVYLIDNRYRLIQVGEFASNETISSDNVVKNQLLIENNGKVPQGILNTRTKRYISISPGRLDLLDESNSYSRSDSTSDGRVFWIINLSNFDLGTDEWLIQY